MKLKNKLAFISSTASSVSFAMAEKFLQEGAKLVIAGKDKIKLELTQYKLGDECLIVSSDPEKISGLEHCYEQAVRHFNQNIDILVVNPGVLIESPLETTDENLYDKIFAINTKSIFFSVQKAIPFLSSGASVILIASSENSTGVKNHSLYYASKAAVSALAKSFSIDLMEKKIRVNSLSPNFNKTISQQDAYCQEIATTALFLAADGNNYLTGIDMPVEESSEQTLFESLVS